MAGQCRVTATSSSVTWSTNICWREIIIIIIIFIIIIVYNNNNNNNNNNNSI